MGWDASDRERKKETKDENENWKIHCELKYYLILVY